MNKLITLIVLVPLLESFIVASFVSQTSKIWGLVQHQQQHVHWQCPIIPMERMFVTSTGTTNTYDVIEHDEKKTTTTTTKKSLLNLPPGRRTTPRFLSFLFDDTIKLLNPKTMGSYQVQRSKQYGTIYKTNIFTIPTIVATGTEETIALLGKEESRTKLRAGTEAFFPPHHKMLFGSNSILVQSGETHDRLRRLIQQCLSPTLMTTLYQPTIDNAMDKFLTDLTTVSTTNSDGYFELVPQLRSFFISIALQVLLGESNESTSSNSTILSDLTTDVSIWSKGLLAPPLTFIPWSAAANAMRARKRIIATMTPLIEQERLMVASNTNTNSNSTNSLLAKLVSSVDEQTGTKLSNDDIMDNILTLIFAGSDTTASSATSLWMTLSLYPHIKEEFVQLQNNNSNDPQQIDKFIERILQSYPPAPFSMRSVKEKLTVQNYDIPPGWLVVYGFAGALESKKTNWTLLSEPQSTNMKSTTTVSSTASTSTAFGAGPRMCPGRYLAILELTILCKKLLNPNFNWTLKANQNLLQTYTPGFFPKDGLVIKLD